MLPPPNRHAQAGAGAAHQLEMQGLELGPHLRPSNVLWKLQPKLPANPNRRGPHRGDRSGLLGGGSSWKRCLRPARGTVAGSQRTAGQGKCPRGETPRATCAEIQPPFLGRAPTHPPLLILLPIHDDHIALGECQLIWVVGHAVIQRFDPLRLQPGLREGSRGQRLVWPGGTAVSRELGPGALTIGAGESWEGPEEEGKIPQLQRAGNMAAGASCARVLSPGAVERGPCPPAGSWCGILPERSWVQEETTPLPNQGKRGRSASSEPSGNKPQRAYYAQSKEAG